MNHFDIVSVPFRGDRLSVHVYEDGGEYLAINGPCNALGLPYEREAERLRHEFPRQCRDVGAASGGYLLLACTHVPAWLFLIPPRDCRPHFQEDLRAYKEDLAGVMYAHVRQRHAVAPAGPASPANHADLLPALLAQNRLIEKMLLAQQEARREQALVKAAAEDAQVSARNALDEVKGYPGYCTVAGFWRTHGVRVTDHEAQRIGAILADRCRREGRKMRKTPHERWGWVNSYPLEVLRRHFERYKGTGHWWG